MYVASYAAGIKTYRQVFTGSSNFFHVMQLLKPELQSRVASPASVSIL